LFYRKEKENYIFCAIHVDDMIVVSSDEKYENKYMKEIAKNIEIKDIGEAKSILGIQIEQERECIKVHIKNYIYKLLELYGMIECNPVTTPIDINVKMDKEYEYQELLGRLMYISVHARPDISYAVSCLSQFNHNPKQMHMVALKRILRYLKGTIEYCLENIEISQGDNRILFRI